jgi:uncharacterized protein YkwD
MPALRSLVAPLFFALALSALPALAYTDPFICMVNAARAANGSPPLGFSPNLQNVAKWVAEDMYVHDYVGHFGRWVFD